jgi:hypothetical protein
VSTNVAGDYYKTVGMMTERNGLAVAFAVCALTMAALMADHSIGNPGVVHGAFIVVQCVLMVCFVIGSRMLGPDRVAVIVGMVMICVGCGALIASMLLDGFVSEALRARSSADPGTARILLGFCGTLIRFLMPLGLILQSVAMLSWSSVLLTGAGVARGVGIFGSVCAATVLGLFLPFTNLSAYGLIGAIVVQVVWYLGLAAALLQSGRSLSRQV